MINKMIILSVILFPLQNYGIAVAGSRYDITAFIILFIAFYVSIKNQIFSKKTVFVMFLFLFSQLFIFYINGTTPFYRLFSGMVWLGGLLLVIQTRDRLVYNPVTVYKSILIVLLITSCIIIYQFFVLGQSQGKASFDESSKAALALFSSSAGILGLFYFYKLPKKLSIKLFFAFLILFGAGIITFSMHIVTFILVVILIVILNFPLIYSKIKTRQLLYFSLFSFLTFLGLKKLMTTQHFFQRIDIWNLLSNNYSLLSWRTGFDQMIAGIIRSPVLGNGLGSTGFIEFESYSLDHLLSIYKFALNLSDAYSLTFRLIIEIGLPLFLLMMYFFLKKILCLRKYLRVSRELPLSYRVPVVFNFLFSISIIIGSLIKEPLYPSSVLYLGTLLFVTSKID